MFIMRQLILLSIFFVCMSSCVYARCNDHSIRCPTISAIQRAASSIDDAEFVNGAYIATTPPYAIHTSDFGWFAVVYNIQANSKEAAMAAARRTMQSTSTQSSPYAKSAGCIYHCEYDDGKIEVVNNE